MATLFTERRLIHSFRNRSVVYSNRANVDNGTFMTRVDLEFGSSGAIGLKTIINLQSLARLKDKAIYAKEYTAVVEKLMGHYRAVNEHIAAFDETIEWLRTSDRWFHGSTIVGHNPLFIHGSRSATEVRIDIFSRNSSGLNLGFELTKPDHLKYGIARLTELRECLVGYRDQFMAIDINDAVAII